MLKLLQIGCGNISNTWLSSLAKRNDIEFCGLVDIDRDAAREKVSAHGLQCPIFTDAAKAIKATSPHIAIDNIIPSERLALAEICMSNGLHVLSEKPLADNIDNAKKIIKLSDKYNRDFFVMQNRRYNTNMFSYRNAIQSGRIGEIGYLGVEFFRDPHFGGFRDIMDSPLLIDMAIHTFDQARFLLGKNPVSVICKEYNPGWSWYKGNSSAICIFTFEDGTIFNYTGSWCAPGMNTSWDSGWRTIGSKGSCLWNGNDFPTAGLSILNDVKSCHPDAESIIIDRINCDIGGHAGCINEMIESIKAGSRAQTDCRDNIISMAMVFAAIKSSAKNREIQIKNILEE